MALHQQLEVGLQRLKLGKFRYEHGVLNFLEVFDAQRAHFANQQSAVQVRLAQLQNRIHFYRALRADL